MKKLVYIDNFREIYKTVTPLTDVNFLIGENSTGKSSFLALLKIISGDNFWHNSRFFSKDAYLGSIRDIINPEFSNNFKVGCLKFDEKVKEYIYPEFYLISFVEIDGEIVPEKYSFIKKNKSGEYTTLITMVFSDKETKLKANDITECKPENSVLEFFDFVAKAQDAKDKTDYKYDSLVQEKQDIIPINMRLLFGYTLASMQSFEGKNKKKIFNEVKSKFYEAFESFSKESLTLFAPVRATPKAIYSDSVFLFSSAGEHIPYLIRKMLAEGKKNNTKHQEELKVALENFGKNSGLFKQIGIKNLGEGSESPFELWVELFDKRFKINNVGYGVSQILPIVFEILINKNNTCFGIQQPEVHLHPKGQAAFGEFLFERAMSQKHKFIIETHSDFIIDRFRLQYLRFKSRKNKPKSQVLFFEKNESGNSVYPIPIEANGRYSENQPQSFREFFIKEELALLDL